MGDMKAKNISMYDYVNGSTFKKAAIILSVTIPLLLIPCLKIISIAALLVLLNLVFSFSTRFLRKSGLGIELTTFLTIVSALKFGSFFGAVLGFFFIVSEYIGTMRFSIMAVVTVPCVMILGFVAPLIPEMNIAVLGITLSVIYNIITFFLCYAIRRRMVGLLIFSASNIIFNKIMFSVLGKFFV